MSDTTSSMNLSIQPPKEKQSTATSHIGYGLGKWVRMNGHKIIVGLLIVLVVFIFLKLLKQISDAETLDSESSFLGAAAAYTNSIRHNKCRGRGGCSRKCPYITEDDPRVIICKQADSIESLSTLLRQGLQEDSASIENAISRLSPDVGASVAIELEAVQAIKARCSANMTALASKVRSLDATHGMSETVTADVINAKNRATAMETAAVICKNVYVAAFARASSCVLNARIQDIPAIDHSRIDGYDSKALSSKINTNTIQSEFDKLSATIADSVDPESYSAILLSVQDDAVRADPIIAAIAAMTSMAKDSHLTVNMIVPKFEIVIELFNLITQQTEGFSNDLPGTMDSEQITKFIDDNDYSSAVIRTALEPEIVSNHNKFAKERATFDSGGGVPSVRDDDNDVVKWVGLFGRPTYQRSDGSSADKSSEPLRSIPSDIPEDLMRKNTPRLSFA